MYANVGASRRQGALEWVKAAHRHILGGYESDVCIGSALLQHAREGGGGACTCKRQIPRMKKLLS